MFCLAFYRHIARAVTIVILDTLVVYLTCLLTDSTVDDVSYVMTSLPPSRGRRAVRGPCWSSRPTVSVPRRPSAPSRVHASPR